MKKRKLAIFDIDGTIFRSSLVVELTHLLIEENIFPKSLLKEITKHQTAWKNRHGDYDKYVLSVVDAYIKNISGKEERVIKKQIKKFLSQQKDRQYIFTRDLIKELREKNYFLLAISGSPINVVEEFVKALSFDAFFGSLFEIKNGKFTGKHIIDMQADKRSTIKKFVEENRETVTLTGSVGVGDTASDVPILQMVDNPVAFNPNSALIKIAKKKKWKIVVERKDVIYELKDFDFITS